MNFLLNIDFAFFLYCDYCTAYILTVVQCIILSILAVFNILKFFLEHKQIIFSFIHEISPQMPLHKSVHGQKLVRQEPTATEMARRCSSSPGQGRDWPNVHWHELEKGLKFQPRSKPTLRAWFVFCNRKIFCIEMASI